MVILATKNSESLPENIAGWRPQCGWLGHRWVGYSCRLRGPKSVHSGNGRSLLALRHLCHCQSVRHFNYKPLLVRVSL